MRARSTVTVFLLSPASATGRRAAALFRPGADFDLARRVRDGGGAPLGEVFTFISGLYFRGKLTYARTFARPPAGLPGTLVITAGSGLVEPDTIIGAEEMADYARIPIDLREPRYREPLEEDAARLANALPPDARVVLLGSLATARYTEPLLARLGQRLCFPAPFPGIGDMQRGSILLRAARQGEELSYEPVGGILGRAGAARRKMAG